MEKEIVCDCGWRVRGSEDELVAAAQEHGRTAHDMVPDARAGAGHRQARPDGGVTDEDNPPRVRDRGATAEQVFAALTTTEGLSGWWTTKVSAPG